MTIKLLVEKEITGFMPGKIFTYSDLSIFHSRPAITVKTLSHLVLNGELRRFSKKYFYRPKMGLFGEMQLSDNEKLKPYLYCSGQRTGYITGTALYNRLGLTTQLPRIIRIASDKSYQRIDLGTIELKLIRAKAPVTEKNRKFLEILDVLADLKNIPDSQPSFSLIILASKLKDIVKEGIKELIILSRVYPPVTRAMLGMLLSSINSNSAMDLKKELKPISRYKIGLGEKWNNAKEWNLE